MPSMVPMDKVSPEGHVVPNILNVILWTQRVEKEEHVNARLRPVRDVRASVKTMEVPKNFKPGHCMGIQSDVGPFDVAKVGFDPIESKELVYALESKENMPRDRHPFPETSYQDHGWLLSRAGDQRRRTAQKQLRMGFGWLEESPHEFHDLPETIPKRMTAAEATPIPRAKILGRNPREKLGVPPFATSTPSLKALQTDLGPSRSSSVPAFSGNSSVRSGFGPGMIPGRLRHREKRLADAMHESMRYQHATGQRGNKWNRPLNETDATAFANNFITAHGGPLHLIKPDDSTPVLTDPKLGTAIPRWKK